MEGLSLSLCSQLWCSMLLNSATAIPFFIWKITADVNWVLTMPHIYKGFTSEQLPLRIAHTQIFFQSEVPQISHFYTLGRLRIADYCWCVRPCITDNTVLRGALNSRNDVSTNNHLQCMSLWCHKIRKGSSSLLLGVRIAWVHFWDSMDPTQ